MKQLPLPALITGNIMSALITIGAMVGLLYFQNLIFYGIALIFLIIAIIGNVQLGNRKEETRKVFLIICFLLMLFAVMSFAYPLIAVGMITLFLGTPFDFSMLTL